MPKIFKLSLRFQMLFVPPTKALALDVTSKSKMRSQLLQKH